MIRNAMVSLAAWTMLMGAPALAHAAAQSPPQGSATAEADARLAKVRAHAKATPAKESQEAEDEMGKVAKSVDAEAAEKGDVTIASRIATDFKETTDAVLAERSKYGAGWGELLIAHSLVAQSKTDLTLDQVFQLRSEGMGWGQIVKGMDVKLGKVTSASRALGRSTTGASKSEGAGSHGQDQSAAAAARAAAGAAHARAGAGLEHSMSRGHGGR